MSLVKSVKSSLDSFVICFQNNTNKIMTNPSAVKRTGKVAIGIIEGLNYYTKTTRLPELVTHLKGLNSGITIIETVGDLTYWINPFNATRSTISILTKACETIARLGTNLQALQSWKYIDLAQQSTAFGSGKGALSFIGRTVTIKTFAVIRFSLMVYEASTSLLKAYKISDKTTAKQEQTKAIWTIVSATCDLAENAAPLLVTSNPPLFFGLAVLSNGVGLLKILAT